MTLAIGVTSPGGIWLVVDRRLTPTPRGAEPDRALKVLDYEATDGRALIGYAGVGSTPGNVEPSEWMSRVLRGRRENLETAVKLLAIAVRDSLAPIARRMRTAHVVVIAAFKNGKPVMYGIELAHTPDKKRWFFRAITHQPPSSLRFGQRSPFMYLAGSGAPDILGFETLALRRIVKAYDAGRISAEGVAYRFARVNYLASKRNRTISPRSIVVWRPLRANGGHLFFDGERLEHSNEVLPAISCGFDVKAILDLYAAEWLKPLRINAESGRPEFPELDLRDADAKLAKLPTHPDDTLT